MFDASANRNISHLCPTYDTLRLCRVVSKLTGILLFCKLVQIASCFRLLKTRSISILNIYICDVNFTLCLMMMHSELMWHMQDLVGLNCWLYDIWYLCKNNLRQNCIMLNSVMPLQQAHWLWFSFLWRLTIRPSFDDYGICSVVHIMGCRVLTIVLISCCSGSVDLLSGRAIWFLISTVSSLVSIPVFYCISYWKCGIRN